MGRIDLAGVIWRAKDQRYIRRPGDGIQAANSVYVDPQWTPEHI